MCKAKSEKKNMNKNMSIDNINSEETLVEIISIKEISKHIEDSIASLENEDIKDRNRCQELETKIAALNCLVKYLNIEMATNNLWHVESVVNNL
ncbi:29274_t:CDS:2, partial [Racocetra persica]